MAKLVLTIQAKNDAIKSVQALKAEVQSLSQSLSAIKTNASGVETTRKGYANLITTLKTLKSQYADGVFGDMPEQAEKALKVMERLSAAFQKNKTLTKDEAKEYAEFSQQLKKLAADLATVKAKNDKIVAANPFTVTQAQQIPRLIKQYSTLLNHIKSIEKYYPKGTFDTFKADLTEGTTQLQGLNQEYQTTQTLTQDSQAQLNGLADGFLQVNAAVAQTTSTIKSSKGSLIDIVTGFAKFQLSAMLVMKPLQWIRSALTSINETLVKTEDAVIALQRVLPTGSATDDEISSRLYKVAQDYGQTFENVSEIATNFARSGMSWADTIKATEAAVLALNVAELDAEEATNGLIAILSQFGLTASDLETVIDELNKTADNFPVTTEKILAALQRTGSAASNAKLSLKETVALITALSKATGRSGENIGTALNSLIQYSSKASALDTFAALSEASEEVVEKFRRGGATILDVWRQVSAEIKNLKADQADLLDQYFSTEDGEALKDALDGELQDIYTELGGVYDTANTFRKNYFIALLGNMDTVEQAMGTLEGAAGYSQKENEKYLDTYTAKLNSLKAQWQDIANSEQGLLGIKKALVDVGSVLLTIIQWTGGLRTTLLAISTVVWLLVGNKIISGFNAIGTAIKGLVTGLRTATTAAQGLQAALGWIGAIATVISFIVGLVQPANEETQRLDSEALSRASEGLSTLRDNVQQNIDRFDELKHSVEEARAVLADSTSTTEAITAAQNTLTTIQDTLTRSNKDYADSLDLTNGELSKQLNLLAQIGEANAREKVQKYLDENADAIYSAKQYKQQKFGDITFSEIVGLWEGLWEDAPLEAWLKSLGYNAEEGSAFWEGIGSFFTNSKAFSTNLYTDGMTKDEQIEFLEELFKKARYEENADYLKAQIREAINAIKNDETYQSVENLLSGSDNTWGAPIEVLEKFRDGVITYEEFLKEIGLLQEEINEELEVTDNTLENLAKEKIQSLVAALKAMREEQEASLELEEQKQKVIDAQNALLAAQQLLDKANNGILTLGDLDEENLQALLDIINNMREEEQIALDIEEKKQAVLEAQNVLAEKQTELTRAQNALRLAQMGIATDLGDYSESALKALADGISDLINAEKLALEIEEKKREIIDAQNDLIEKQNALTKAQGILAAAQAGTADLADFSESALKALADGISDLINAEKLALEIEEKKREIIDAENDLIEKQNALTKAQNALVSAQAGTITDLSDLTENALNALIDGLKRLREEEEDSVELEEKKLAVLEAQRALENAKNERSTRRFNSETGQYEWQVDEKKVADAEESLQAAIDALNEYIDNQAWEDVVAELESGNATNDSIKSILDKWLSEGLSQETYERILSGIYDLQKSQPVIDALNADFEALQAEYDEALQNLNDLRDSFNEYLEQKAWEEVKDAIASGNVDDAQIRAILDKWSAEGLPEETYNKIASSIESLKLSQPVIDALNADFEALQAEYDEALQSLNDLRDSFNQYLEQKAWEEVKDAITSGNVDDAQIRAILDKWSAEGLPEETYNKIASSIESLKLSQPVIDALNADFEAAQKSYDEASEKVQSAIESLHSYLKDKAWDEIKEAIASGNVDDATLQEILNKWRDLGLPQDNYDQIRDTIQKAIDSDAFKDVLKSTVDQLQKSYDDVLSEYEKWLEDKVWKDVIAELESGKATNDSIKDLLDKWKAESYQDGLPSWYQGIIEAIEKYSGVELTENSNEEDGNDEQGSSGPDDYFNALRDANYFSSRGLDEGAFRNGVSRQFSSDPDGLIDYLKELYSHWTATPQTDQEYYDELKYWGMSQGQLANLQRSLANPSLTEEDRIARLKKELSALTGKTYDKGGAAIGKGLMPKATDKPEVINDPELTAKILEPVSNEHFHRYVRDMGLLFETSRQYAQTPVIERVGGNTDNRIDNSGQTIINGVRVGADMMNKPLVEVLRYIKFMM